MEHSILPNIHLHEPKGIDTALEGQAYVANGAGSGAWETLNILRKASAFPLGTVMPYSGTEAPQGWLFCYGQEVNRIQYSALFFVIGTFYGIGNGVDTFNLPDFRGRTPAAINNGTDRIQSIPSGVNGDAMGGAGGTSTSALTTATIPSMVAESSTDGSHTHTLNNSSTLVVTTGNVQLDSGSAVRAVTMSVASAGTHTHALNLNNSSPNTPHNNIMPTLVTNMMIYVGQ